MTARIKRVRRRLRVRVQGPRRASTRARASAGAVGVRAGLAVPLVVVGLA